MNHTRPFPRKGLFCLCCPRRNLTFMVKIQLNMKKLTLFALALTGITMASCSKNDSSGPSKTELITSGTWKFKSAGIDVNADGFADTNLPPGYELYSCQTDNTLLLKTDGTGTLDEGATKCDPADAQSTAITWSFKSNETVINFPQAVYGSLSGDVKIVKLTSASLILAKTVNIGGTSNVDIIVEMIH